MMILPKLLNAIKISAEASDQRSLDQEAKILLQLMRNYKIKDLRNRLRRSRNRKSQPSQLKSSLVKANCRKTSKTLGRLGRNPRRKKKILMRTTTSLIS
jgi:hypothetical protein